MEKDISTYVIIPKREELLSSIDNIFNNKTILDFSVGIRKNISNRQLKLIYAKGSYIEKKTEEIAEDFFRLANSFDKALRKIKDLEKLNINPLNYVEQVFKIKEKEILDYTDKYLKPNERDTNRNRLKKFLKKYYYKPKDITSFCVFIYEAWETIQLDLLNLYISDKTPYLFDLFGNYLINDRIQRFLNNNESYSHFRLIAEHNDENEEEEEKEFNNKVELDEYKKSCYNMIIATEELRNPIVFEVINSLCASSQNKRYKICANKECNNLFRSTRIDRIYCNSKECLSSLSLQSQSIQKNKKN